MKCVRAILMGASLAVLVTSCVTVSQYKFSLDTDTGEVRREYYDITSRKGADEKDYSVTNDWAALKRIVEEQKPEYDPGVVEDVAKVLFEEDDVL